MFVRGMGSPYNWLETDDDQALDLGMENETRPMWPGLDQTGVWPNTC